MLGVRPTEDREREMHLSRFRTAFGMMNLSPVLEMRTRSGRGTTGNLSWAVVDIPFPFLAVRHDGQLV